MECCKETDSHGESAFVHGSRTVVVPTGCECWHGARWKRRKYLRPVLILRGFGADACLVVPLTTSDREHPLRVSVGTVDGREARANLSQIRVVDTRRLVEKIGFLDREKFASVRKAAKGLL